MLKLNRSETSSIGFLAWLSVCGAFPHLFWVAFDLRWLPWTFDPAPLVPVIWAPQRTLLSPRDDMASSVGALVLALLIAWLASMVIGISGAARSMSRRDRMLLWAFQQFTLIAGVRTGEWGWYLFLVSRGASVDIGVVAGNSYAPVLLAAPYACQVAAFLALGAGLLLRRRDLAPGSNPE